MPLRDLFYVGSVLQGRVRDANLYSRKIVRIPAPKFIVFYNGTDIQPEQQILRLSEAVEKAVDDCIGKGILSDFLSKNRAEAIAMSIFEYDEEKHKRNEREEGREEGREEAFELMQKLMKDGRNDDMKRALADKEYRKQLYRQYHMFQ